MKNELDLLKQKKLTGCHTEVVSRKVVTAKSDLNGSVDESSWGTFRSYASILHNVDQSLAEVSERLKKIFDRVAAELQQGICVAICGAAGRVQKLFVGACEIVYKSLSLIVGQTRCGDSALPGSLSAHSANQESRRTHKMAASDSGGVF